MDTQVGNRKGLTAHYYFTFSVDQEEQFGEHQGGWGGRLLRTLSRVPSDGPQRCLLQVDVQKRAVVTVARENVKSTIPVEDLATATMENGSPDAVLLRLKSGRALHNTFQSPEDAASFLDVLSEVMAGTYTQVKGPRAVLKRGALQKRGNSGVFFNRFAVVVPFKMFVMASRTSGYPTATLWLKGSGISFDSANRAIYLKAGGRDWTFRGMSDEDAASWYLAFQEAQNPPPASPLRNVTWSPDTLQHAPSLPEGTELGPRMFSLSPEALQELEAVVPPNLRASLKAMAGLLEGPPLANPLDDEGKTIKAFPQGTDQASEDVPLRVKYGVPAQGSTPQLDGAPAMQAAVGNDVFGDARVAPDEASQSSRPPGAEFADGGGGGGGTAPADTVPPAEPASSGIRIGFSPSLDTVSGADQEDIKTLPSVQPAFLPTFEGSQEKPGLSSDSKSLGTQFTDEALGLAGPEEGAIGGKAQENAEQVEAAGSGATPETRNPTRSSIGPGLFQGVREGDGTPVPLPSALAHADVQTDAWESSAGRPLELGGDPTGAKRQSHQGTSTTQWVPSDATNQSCIWPSGLSGFTDDIAPDMWPPRDPSEAPESMPHVFQCPVSPAVRLSPQPTAMSWRAQGPGDSPQGTQGDVAAVTGIDGRPMSAAPSMMPWQNPLYNGPGPRTDSREMDGGWVQARGGWVEEGSPLWLDKESCEQDRALWQLPLDQLDAAAPSNPFSDRDAVLAAQIHGILERVRQVLAEVGAFSRAQTKVETEFQDMIPMDSFPLTAGEYIAHPDTVSHAFQSRFQASIFSPQYNLPTAQMVSPPFLDEMGRMSGVGPPQCVPRGTGSLAVFPAQSQPNLVPSDGFASHDRPAQASFSQRQSHQSVNYIPHPSRTPEAPFVHGQARAFAPEAGPFERGQLHPHSPAGNNQNWRWHSNAAFTGLEEPAGMDPQIDGVLWDAAPAHKLRVPADTSAPGPSVAVPTAAKDEGGLRDITVGSGFATYEDVLRLLAVGRQPPKARHRRPHVPRRKPDKIGPPHVRHRRASATADATSVAPMTVPLPPATETKVEAIEPQTHCLPLVAAAASAETPHNLTLSVQGGPQISVTVLPTSQLLVSFAPARSGSQPLAQPPAPPSNDPVGASHWPNKADVNLGETSGGAQTRARTQSAEQGDTPAKRDIGEVGPEDSVPAFLPNTAAERSAEGGTTTQAPTVRGLLKYLKGLRTHIENIAGSAIEQDGQAAEHALLDEVPSQTTTDGVHAGHPPASTCHPAALAPPSTSEDGQEGSVLQETHMSQPTWSSQGSSGAPQTADVLPVGHRVRAFKSEDLEQFTPVVSKKIASAAFAAASSVNAAVANALHALTPGRVHVEVRREEGRPVADRIADIRAAFSGSTSQATPCYTSGVAGISMSPVPRIPPELQGSRESTKSLPLGSLLAPDAPLPDNTTDPCLQSALRVLRDNGVRPCEGQPPLTDIPPDSGGEAIAPNPPSSETVSLQRPTSGKHCVPIPHQKHLSPLPITPICNTKSHGIVACEQRLYSQSGGSYSHMYVPLSAGPVNLEGKSTVPPDLPPPGPALPSVAAEGVHVAVVPSTPGPGTAGPLVPLSMLTPVGHHGLPYFGLPPAQPTYHVLGYQNQMIQLVPHGFGSPIAGCPGMPAGGLAVQCTVPAGFDVRPPVSDVIGSARPSCNVTKAPRTPNCRSDFKETSTHHGLHVCSFIDELQAALKPNSGRPTYASPPKTRSPTVQKVKHGEERNYSGAHVADSPPSRILSRVSSGAGNPILASVLGKPPVNDSDLSAGSVAANFWGISLRHPTGRYHS
eukprot:jgi/Botrbrau1/9644/Bobra.0131s0020.1